MYLNGESGGLDLVPAQLQTSWGREQVTREEVGSTDCVNSQTPKDHDPLQGLPLLFFFQTVAELTRQISPQVLEFFSPNLSFYCKLYIPKKFNHGVATNGQNSDITYSRAREALLIKLDVKESQKY